MASASLCVAVFRDAAAADAALRVLRAEHDDAVEALNSAKLDKKIFDIGVEKYAREKRESHAMLKERLPALKRAFESYRDKSIAPVLLTAELTALSDSLLESFVRVYQCPDWEVEKRMHATIEILLTLKRKNLTDSHMWAVCQRAYYFIFHPPVPLEIDLDVVFDSNARIAYFQRRVKEIAKKIATF